MRILFSFIFAFYSFGLCAQSTASFVEERLRPLIYEAEQQLDSQMKVLLKETLRNNSIVVKNKLSLDTGRIISRVGLGLNRSRLQLPGLDQVPETVTARTKEFRPTLHDVFSWASALEVKVFSNKVFSDSDQELIRQALQESINALNIKQFNVSFPPPVIENLSALKDEQIKADNSQTNILNFWILGSILFGVVILGLVIFYVSRSFVKKIEKMTGAIVQSLSSIEISVPETGKRADTPASPSWEQLGRPSNESLVELKGKISEYLSSRNFDLDKCLKIFFAMKSSAKTFLILDCLQEKDRELAKGLMSPEDHHDYSQFLSEHADGLISEDKLIGSARELIKEISLFTHNPELLQKSLLKGRLYQLNSSQLKFSIEHFDSKEFSYLIQFANPVALAETLSKDPALLDKYPHIPKFSFDYADVSEILSKVESLVTKSSQDSSYGLIDYLPEQLENLLAKKLGVTSTSWDKLGDKQGHHLVDYALGLKIDDLAAFMAIIPGVFQKVVWDVLPELTVNRLKSRGLHINQRSYELKHDFLKKMKLS